VNQVHMPHGSAAGRRSMVHGGPWAEARPDLAGVQAHRRCNGPEIDVATPKRRGDLSGLHRGLRWPGR
jgi:hypothetical protein